MEKRIGKWKRKVSCFFFELFQGLREICEYVTICEYVSSHSCQLMKSESRVVLDWVAQRWLQWSSGKNVIMDCDDRLTSLAPVSTTRKSNSAVNWWQSPFIGPFLHNAISTIVVCTGLPPRMEPETDTHARIYASTTNNTSSSYENMRTGHQVEEERSAPSNPAMALSLFHLGRLTLFRIEMHQSGASTDDLPNDLHAWDG